MGEIIDGRAIAHRLREEMGKELDGFRDRGYPLPGLAVVLVGDDPASAVYVRMKEKACKKLGIHSSVHRLPDSASQDEVIDIIRGLNNSPDVNGILVQLPLPRGISADTVLETIDKDKDVDGFHPYNMGRLVSGNPIFVPCTPSGILRLLDETGIEIEGKEAVVIGRSNIVGKPVASLLLQRNATVTICHTRTRDLVSHIKRAEILVVAAGKPRVIKGEWIRDGAVVIDVGVNRLEDGSLCGDVEFESAIKRASYITPVPGGVGPMTITMLLYNTIKAAKRQLRA